MDKIYIYDGSFSGFLTAVFYAYLNHERPCDICTDEAYQMNMTAESYPVTTENDKAERVMKALLKKVGKSGFFHIYEAFLSEEEKREALIFDYIGIVLKIGKQAEYLYSNATAAKVMKLSKKTGNEAHLFRGFLRFSETEEGIYYAEFEPKTDCISLVAPHFCARLSGLEFAINDRKRKKAAYWNKKELSLICYESFEKPTETSKEAEFKAMWKSFYKKVSIDERKNEKCRMTHMPKRFWRYMCETEEIQ